MTNNITEWTAEAVRLAIKDSGRSKRSVSDETGIPYPTLNRKVKAQSDFSFRDLLLLAEALGVSPSTFTPPVFIRVAPHESEAA